MSINGDSVRVTRARILTFRNVTRAQDVKGAAARILLQVIRQMWVVVHNCVKSLHCALLTVRNSSPRARIINMQKPRIRIIKIRLSVVFPLNVSGTAAAFQLAPSPQGEGDTAQRVRVFEVHNAGELSDRCVDVFQYRQIHFLASYEFEKQEISNRGQCSGQECGFIFDHAPPIAIEISIIAVTNAERQAISKISVSRSNIENPFFRKFRHVFYILSDNTRTRP
jgi:hypothetical protein